MHKIAPLEVLRRSFLTMSNVLVYVLRCVSWPKNG